MGIFTANDPTTGLPVDFRISGDQPTDTEMARIQQHFAGSPSSGSRFDQLSDAEFQRLMALYGEAQPEIDPDNPPGTALGRGFDRGMTSAYRALGAAIEAGGDWTGSDVIEEYGRGMVERAEEEQQREAEELAPPIDWRDIGGVGDLLRFAGEQFGQTAPEMGAIVGAGLVGSLAGGLPGGVAAGTTVGTPFFFGRNVERTEEALGRPLESDEYLFSFLTAGGQSAINAVADLLLAGPLARIVAAPGQMAVGRAVRGFAGGAAVEIPTEVAQQIAERWQAGLPLDDDEALAEYADAAVAAGVIGGPIGATTSVAFVEGPRAVGRQLDEDQLEEGIVAGEEIRLSDEALAREEAEIAAAVGRRGRPLTSEDRPIGLPAPRNRTTSPNVTARRLAREAAREYSRIRLSSLPAAERIAIERAREAERIAFESLDEADRIAFERAGGSANAPSRRTTTLEEIRQVVGDYAANREAAKQKPVSASASAGTVGGVLFNQAQLNAAIASADSGKVNFPSVQRAIRSVTEGRIPNDVVNAVLDEMVARGVVRRAVNKKGRTTYQVEQRVEGATSPDAIARRNVERIDREVEAAEKAREEIEIELRRVEQTGFGLDGRRARPAKVRGDLRKITEQIERLKEDQAGFRRLAASQESMSPVQTTERVGPLLSREEMEGQLRQYEQNLREAKKQESNARKAVARAGERATAAMQQRLAEAENKVSSIQVRRENLRSRIANPSASVQTGAASVAAQNARMLALIGARPEQAPAFTPQFNESMGNVMSALRKRLDKMKLGDVRLQIEKRLDEDANVEGSYANKIIRLASAIYDPSLTETELADRMAEVMDHEVIHALREMGLFSDAEWESLSRAAANTKYVAIKRGQPVERLYSYLDRARRMYGDQSAEVQVEEAVAEMFRAYTTGRNKFTGRPRNLLQRIGDFFRAIFAANKAEGFETPSQIFERIEAGDIGARDRAIIADEASIQDTRFSRRNWSPYRTPDTPAFKNWFRRSVVAEPDGSPRRVFHGTLADFNRFNRVGDDQLGFHVGTAEQASNIIDTQTIESFLRGGTGSMYQPQIMPLFVSIQNPVRLTDTGNWGFTNVLDQLLRIGEIDAETHAQYEEEYLRATENLFEEDSIYGDSVEEIGRNMSVELLKNAGFDGVVYLNRYEGVDKSQADANSLAYMQTLPDEEFQAAFPDAMDSYIVLEPTQIKSAVSNEGQYSPTNEDIRFSRRVSIPDNLANYTILSNYDESGNFRDMAEYRNGKRVARNKEDAVALMQRRRRKVFGMSRKDINQLGRMMAAEAELALRNDRNAIGWYGETFRKAKALLSLLYPEIAENNFDNANNYAMDFAVAVTSNGMAVVDNFTNAAKQYDYWLETGRFMEEGYGNQGQSMVGAFRFYNALKDRGMSDMEIADFLMEKTTVSELRKSPIIAEVGANVDSKENAGTEVAVSYVMGPKIGQGFYQNLRGNFEPLTMDRWWMRMFNRLTGRPFKDVKDATVKQNINRVYNAITSNQITGYEAELRDQAMASLGIDIATEANIQELGIEINRLFQRAFVKAAKDARPEKTELFKAADTLAKNSMPQLQEDPRTGTDRQFMRDVTNTARDILRREAGIDISNADLQALLWYAEKRLWDSYAVRKGKGEDNDYVDGAIALLRERGIEDDRISQALASGDRYRVDPRFDSRGADGRVRGPATEGSAAEGARLSRRPTDATGQELFQPRAGRGTGGYSSGGLAPLEGAPNVVGAAGPDPKLVSVAEQYAAQNGIDLRRQAEFVEVDPERAARIAQAYEEMEHAPQDPAVQAAYADLIQQTLAQYQALVDAGYTFTFFDSATDPYDGNPWNAMRDLRANKTMAVYGTYDGYGTEGLTQGAVDDNPMLRDTGLVWLDQKGVERPVTANDLFRAVHDAFGHGIEGAGFRARGEENAWQAHVRLFTGPAIGVLTSETRGQNSWLNYGPFGEQNRTASLEDTVFAPQKAGIMPEFTWTEGRAADEPYDSRDRFSRRVRSAIAPNAGSTGGSSPQVAALNQMTEYTVVSDWLAKALGTVVRDRKPGEKRAQQMADKFLQKTQDSFIPVARMIKELKDRGLTIYDTIDPYLQQQLYKGRAGGRIAERERGIYRTMTNAIKALRVSEKMKADLSRVSRLAKNMFEAHDSDRMAFAETYLYALHAKERNLYISQIDAKNKSGSGMSDAEADAIIAWFNSNVVGPNKAALENVVSAVRAIVADTNKVRVDAGLIPADLINVRSSEADDATVNRAPDFDNYVPLRGAFDDDSSESHSSVGGAMRYGAGRREDPRALGRDQDRDGYGTNIIANVLFQNSNSVIRAERNKVALAMADLIESNPELTKSFATILERAPQRRALVNGSVRYIQRQDYRDDPYIAVAKRDGQEIIMRFEDANIAGAFNGSNVWDAGHANVIVRSLGKWNRLLSNLVTSWNPEFVISNLMRDLQGAGVNITEFDITGLRRDIFKGIPGAMAGLKRAIRDENFTGEWAQAYLEFERAGGQSAANPMTTLSDQIDNIDTLIKDIGRAGGRQQMLANLRKLGKFMEDYNTVVENAVRLTTFKALRDRGFTEARAAQAARSVTVDFNKTGDIGQFMNSLYLFYNASLQGTFFLFRAGARSKRVRRILAGALVTGFVMDAINAMVSDEDEAGISEYDKLPDWLLEHNFVIMLPEALAPSGRRYIAIPMPYGLNAFYNTGRAMSRTARGGYDVSEGAGTIGTTLMEVFNPLGGTESFLNFAAPTFADPFVQAFGTNVDFTGRDIVREPFPTQQIAQSHLYWNSTSPTAIAVAQALNSATGGTPTISGWADVSPDLLEFWFDYLTGGAGRFVQRTAELPFRVAEAESNEDIMREVPFLRRLYGSVSSREDMATYIRERDEVLLARAELRAAREEGDRERIADARNRFSRELRIAEQVNALENRRRELTRRINAIRENERLPEARRNQIVQRLDEQRQAIISTSLQIMLRP